MRKQCSVTWLGLGIKTTWLGLGNITSWLGLGKGHGLDENTKSTFSFGFYTEQEQWWSQILKHNLS